MDSFYASIVSLSLLHFNTHGIVLTQICHTHLPQTGSPILKSRLYQIRWITLAVLMLQIPPHLLLAYDTELKQRFIDGVSKIPSRISSVSVDANITVTAEWVRPDSNSQEHNRLSETDFVKPEITKRHISMHDGAVLESGLDSRNREYTKVSNSQYAFFLTRPNPSVPYNVNAIMSNEEIASSPQGGLSFTESKDRAISMVFCNWGFSDQPLHKLITDPRFVFKSVDEVEMDGVKYVRVDCDLPISPTTPHILKNAYFILDPQNGWAIKESGCDGPTIGNKMQILHSFRKGSGDFPVIDKSIILHKNAASSAVVMRITHDVQVIPREISEHEFTLSHYGFPEPDFGTPWISTWMKYLLAGLACVAIGYWIKRRRATAAG